MKIFHSVTELSGNTPLLELHRYGEAFGLKAKILAKLECCNIAGSAKDRVALHMIRCAQTEGKLKEGSVIIEPTSGNTGIGLAAMAKAFGYRVILTMPDSMSIERRNLLKAYGAELILTPAAEGMAAAMNVAKEIAAKTPGSFIPSQFDNPANPEAHYLSTGPEIWADTEGQVDFYVAGVGTGGTCCGTGRYLKEKNPAIKVVATEPKRAPILSTGVGGTHGLMGQGPDFIPPNVDMELIDEVIGVLEEDAYAAGRALIEHEGILVGITSGAALWAATQLALREENAGKTIVALLPDSGERYLSTPMFQEN